MWKRSAFVVLTIATCASCISSRTTKPSQEFSVTGRVVAGPSCPVAQNPANPTCADKPVANALIVITQNNGNQVGQILADTGGNFSVSLATGTYLLTPQPIAGYVGTPAAQSVTVGPSRTQVNFTYDTGIR
jgi:hypothetical protein